MFRPAPAGAIDRCAGEREDRGLLDRMRADGSARVLVVKGDLAPRAAGSEPALQWVAPRDVARGAEWAFLGRDEAGTPVLLAAWHGEGEPVPAPDGWVALRDIGAELPAAQAETFVTAVSLGRFLAERFCPACGSAAEPMFAGWARRCTGCGRELFPRTDPAVIVAVTSEDGERILLGANAAWGGRMHSCFAGFVEAGESLETAIHREILEEAGVRVTDVRYVGSQGWPYPRSLMLGFQARAIADDEARADGTEIVEVRWFGRDEIRAGLDGRGVGLPGAVSIAHRLIRQWAYPEGGR